MLHRSLTTELTDDLDGTEGTHTVSFSWQGTNYEIDLNDKNAEKFSKGMFFYVDHARKAGGSAGGLLGRRGRRGGGNDVAAVRAWAKMNGIPVNERERISAEVLAQ